MAKDGIGMMVTPDINSFFARIMGKKWWHYRVAHIGYFNRKSLNILLDRAGFLSHQIYAALLVFQWVISLREIKCLSSKAYKIQTL